MLTQGSLLIFITIISEIKLFDTSTNKSIVSLALGILVSVIFLCYFIIVIRLYYISRKKFDQKKHWIWKEIFEGIKDNK